MSGESHRKEPAHHYQSAGDTDAAVEKWTTAPATPPPSPAGAVDHFTTAAWKTLRVSHSDHSAGDY
jgi:hypothetical protein